MSTPCKSSLYFRDLGLFFAPCFSHPVHFLLYHLFKTKTGAFLLSGNRKESVLRLVTGWFCLEVISNCAMKLLWIKALVKGDVLVLFCFLLLQKVVLQLFSQTQGKFVDLWIIRALRYIRNSFRMLSWYRGHVPRGASLHFFFIFWRERTAQI